MSFKPDQNGRKLAFNAPNIDSLLVLIDIARKEKLPFIIQVSAKLVNFYGIEAINAITKKNSKAIWFSLDHCTDLNLVSKCSRKNGWTSVLFDTSMLPAHESIRLSKIAKRACVKNKVLLESEVGALGTDSYSNPREVAAFASAVKCDLLGIAIGTQHGCFVGSAVNLDLIKSIRRKTAIPLVVHGGSGLDDATLKKVFEQGVYKVNLSTSLKKIYLETVKEKRNYDIAEINKELYSAYHGFIESKMKAIGG